MRANGPNQNAKLEDGGPFPLACPFCPSCYSVRMDTRCVASLVSVVLFAAASDVLSAGENFSGEYADQNFLNGQAVFQMSLEQSGDTVSVWFSAGYNDGHGAAPEAAGTGKVTDKGTVQFKFKDSSKNAGTGRIAPAGEGITVLLKTKHVSDSSCLEFYGQKIWLKRVGAMPLKRNKDFVPRAKPK
jgi:hypothetical protein